VDALDEQRRHGAQQRGGPDDEHRRDAQVLGVLGHAHLLARQRCHQLGGGLVVVHASHSCCLCQAARLLIGWRLRIGALEVPRCDVAVWFARGGAGRL
jgi:hypothetical protein